MGTGRIDSPSFVLVTHWKIRMPFEKEKKKRGVDLRVAQSAASVHRSSMELGNFYTNTREKYITTLF
jgi:hypothetical protein